MAAVTTSESLRRSLEAYRSSIQVELKRGNVQKASTLRDELKKRLEKNEKALRADVVQDLSAFLDDVSPLILEAEVKHYSNKLLMIARTRMRKVTQMYNSSFANRVRDAQLLWTQMQSHVEPLLTEPYRDLPDVVAFVDTYEAMEDSLWPGRRATREEQARQNAELEAEEAARAELEIELAQERVRREAEAARALEANKASMEAAVAREEEHAAAERLENGARRERIALVSATTSSSATLVSLASAEGSIGGDSTGRSNGTPPTGRSMQSVSSSRSNGTGSPTPRIDSGKQWSARAGINGGPSPSFSSPGFDESSDKWSALPIVPPPVNLETIREELSREELQWATDSAEDSIGDASLVSPRQPDSIPLLASTHSSTASHNAALVAGLTADINALSLVIAPSAGDSDDDIPEMIERMPDTSRKAGPVGRLNLPSPSHLSFSPTIPHSPASFGSSSMDSTWAGSRQSTPGTSELCSVRTLDQLNVDRSEPLNTRRGHACGDVFPSQIFVCRPKAPHLAGARLVVKRIECIDEHAFDMKVYEAETFTHFHSHRNILALYSFWPEIEDGRPPQAAGSGNYYKALYLLMERGVYGSLQPRKGYPGNHVLAWLSDVTRGLAAVHSENIIHCNVKPTNIYLNSSMRGMVGYVGRAELDYARQHGILLTDAALPRSLTRTLAYWAPEMFDVARYGMASDMWSLGVTFYHLATGKLPFATSSLDDLTAAVRSPEDIDWHPVRASHPGLVRILTNLIVVNPSKRWNCDDVLGALGDISPK